MNDGRRLGPYQTEPVLAPLSGRRQVGTPGRGGTQLPVAEQTLGLLQVGGSDCPEGTWWQVPLWPPPAHVTQTLLQLVLQQTPSTHRPDAHVEGMPHGWPLISVQTPEALQVLTPEKVPGSGALATTEQVPRFPGRPQLRHDAVQPLLQQ